ncbi:hypothetical protein [Bradyrhizobium sp. SZCCHNR3118]|uniref:hypothetical protein n=1 Tax=Bradyrhizobium sp. SZCCHNR3118 TaxID=3057468 RepID=UPI0029160970|nr:hypothetical protein [Bradyrhizobium sp. SZCCHNR3118]
MIQFIEVLIIAWAIFFGLSAVADSLDGIATNIEAAGVALSEALIPSDDEEF